jgi:hypothetical protein
VSGSITETTAGSDVEATMTGPNARDLNRSLLSALRRVERRTRLRAEYTAGGVTERFFDYVPKGTLPRILSAVLTDKVPGRPPVGNMQHLTGDGNREAPIEVLNS